MGNLRERAMLRTEKYYDTLKSELAEIILLNASAGYTSVTVSSKYDYGVIKDWLKREGFSYYKEPTFPFFSERLTITWFVK